MRDLIIGTAGHVDHGKTALIEALTGYNGDELAEEKARGITIDLSFSHMSRRDSQGGVNVAFIDVPGHEKLIKKMISGAFGFDAALLVVDVNEGIMPQTREHLAVLDITGVRRIVTALSKCDLADAAGIDCRKREIADYMAEHSPHSRSIEIIPVSIYEPESIERLRERLFSLESRSTTDLPLFRCYIDRLFSPRGIGTVVTGTILSGTVATGDKLTVAESGGRSTVRQIQVHGEDRERAHAHQRVALNLDTPHSELAKGFLLVSRGYFRGVSTLDVSLRTTGDLSLVHGSRLLFISGPKRVEADLLLHRDPHYATLKLKERVFVGYDDPFLLLGDGRPIAGGRILIPVGEPIRRRQKLPLLQALERHDFHEAFSLLLSHHYRGFGLISSYQRFGLGHEEALRIASTLEGAFVDEKSLVLYPPAAREHLYGIIRTIYRNNPCACLSPASVILRHKWASEAFVTEIMARMVEEGSLRLEKGIYLRADQDEESVLKRLEDRIYTILDDASLTPEAPFNLYDRLDLDRTAGDRILKSLTRRKKVLRLTHNLFLTDKSLRRALSLMREIISTEGSIDIRTFKARTGMSRKYCIAYLEYLDRSDDVVREGEKRLLRYG